ncbi:aldose epimerase family protein [Treponema brennaborense]|uniref:Aldose 1-epimerase n=1 Tax=Treponema brennaborense (strain DSM 12168 / CIP 105900 / DD5/3) TaxID=906968 RepID=F4LL13_TREBD|nr:aldose epimerase family protein [Treponema brennaborense]AEE16610.1 Aldose 1-epimerase [Treponema brennaborense DSM 12168]
MKINKRKYGLLSDGTKAYLYTIDNGGMSFSVTNYGCVVTSIVLPSKSGRKDDIILGPATFGGLVDSTACYGSFVGRFANRISGARFSLDGTEYVLDKNDGENCLHGGYFRWDKQIWDSEIVETATGSGVRFTRTSPDGEQGMPGTMQVEVTYLLNEHDELVMHYDAVCDKSTPVNFTNHSYFNLKGQGAGNIGNHVFTINCDSYLEADEHRIPSGKILPVEGTVFDFRAGKAIGPGLETGDFNGAAGYDHCYCIERKKGKLQKFASVYEPDSGRTMTVSTDQPGVQLYTANWIEGDQGKNGMYYRNHGGFCLETQQYPDAPNKPEFPCCILKAGEKYGTTTIYGFSW